VRDARAELRVGTCPLPDALSPAVSAASNVGRMPDLAAAMPDASSALSDAASSDLSLGGGDLSDADLQRSGLSSRRVRQAQSPGGCLFTSHLDCARQCAMPGERQRPDLTFSPDSAAVARRHARRAEHRVSLRAAA